MFPSELNEKCLILWFFPLLFSNVSAYASHIDVLKPVREQLGIFDSTVQLSVGIENIGDLIKDLDQALKNTLD